MMTSARTARPTALFRDVEVDGRRVDVTCRDGRIAAISPPHDGGRPASDIVIDGHGGALLPGLHDHHIHLLAAAAALDSVDVSSLAVRDAASFASALRQAGGSGRWVRAVGYHESIAGPLDRCSLDGLVDDRPVRVQHRSGALWVLNSAAVQAIGLDRRDSGLDHEPQGIERDADGRPTGRLWRLDDWLRSRVPSQLPDLRPLGTRLRQLGITGVTDTTPTEDPDQVEWIAKAVAAGDLSQRVVVTGGPRLPPDSAANLPRGPIKLVLSDHSLPPLPEVVDAVRAARRHQRPIAIHTVTADSLVLALAALREVGPLAGDRIEHAAVVLPGLVDDVADLGLTVVTSPGMVRHRGDDYLTEVDPVEVPHLWPCRSLLDAGVPVAAGSDAPFGPSDPWLAIDAASTRTTSAGRTLGHHEAITPRRALGLLLAPLLDPGGPERRIAVGADADLCLLDRPLHDALAAPTATTVVTTLIDGQMS